MAQSRRILAPTVLRSLALTALGALSLLIALAGCGIPAVGAPSAQDIYDRAAHSAMQDAKLTLNGATSTNVAGVAITLNMTGNGLVVLKPAAAMQLTLTMNLSGQQLSGTVVVDLIAVGDKLYTKTQMNIPGLPSNPSDNYSVTSSDTTTLLPQHVTNLAIVGEDTIRGDKCWHLTGSTFTNAVGTPVASGTSGAVATHVDEWIRERDYYYVRLKTDALPGLSLPGGGATSAAPTAASGTPGASAGSGFTFDFSDYDKGAKVIAPPADQVTTS
jgi:hypothetical protein